MVNYSENAIREAAYYIWQNAGCPQGQDEQFWAMAVEQLCGGNSCGCSKSSSSKSASCKSATAKKAAPKKTVKK